jgi:hypothetical protein
MMLRAIRTCQLVAAMMSQGPKKKATTPAAKCSATAPAGLGPPHAGSGQGAQMVAGLAEVAGMFAGAQEPGARAGDEEETAAPGAGRRFFLPDGVS